MNKTFADIKRLIETKKDEFKNPLQEAIQKDEKIDWDVELANANTNALVRRVARELGLATKEMTMSDAANAMTAMYSQVLQATEHEAVARDIINVIPVTTPSTRFYKRTRGSVWRIAEGPPTESSGRFTYQEVTLDHEYGEDALFTRNYIEDCPFAVIEAELAEVGQLLEEQLTSDALTLYDAITEANLAGGAHVDTTTSGTLAWKDLTAGWRTLKKAGYHRMPGRKVLLVGPYELEDLFNDEKFINALYPASSQTDIARGVIGSLFGFTVVESDLVADDTGGSNGNYAYMMNVDQAAVVTMRRDKLVQPYSEKLAEGIIATNRYGIAALREDAVVRIDIVHS